MTQALLVAFPDLDAVTLRALLARDGGELVDLDAFSPSSNGHVRPASWVLLAAEMVFVRFAVVRRVRLARRIRREAQRG